MYHWATRHPIAARDAGVAQRGVTHCHQLLILTIRSLSLKETFGRDGDYLKQEAEKEDAWKKDLPYRGKTVWAWWAKAHAYGCMVHGINPILGAGEGAQGSQRATRIGAKDVADLA